MTLPSRPDLLALGPEALTAQNNAGLVKRAMRELEEGRRPLLSADGDVLVARWDDATLVRLGPRESTCTCGAPKCRHRIAAVLAYREEAGATAAPSALPQATDDALLAAFGKARMDEAARLRDEGVTVFVHPPTARDPIASVRLPSCTVRFVGSDPLGGADCDCAAKGPCAHVVVALWAFSELGEPMPRLFQLRPGATARPASTIFDAVVLQVVARGVTGLGESFAVQVGRARAEAERTGARWLDGALAELLALVDAYGARSTRYEATRVTAVLAELVARTRATLPPDFVLGIGLPGETRLERTRLLSLGARLTTDGEQLRAAITLVEPESGVPMVLEKSWVPEDAALEPARRHVLPRIALGTLASSQLVSDGAWRAADGTVRFAATRGAVATSVLPQSGDWGRLSTKLVRTDFAATADAAPAFLGPRTRTASLCVLAAPRVENLAFSEADQSVSATLVDANGAAIELVRRHEPAAPSALAVLAEWLPHAEFVAGDLRPVHGGLVLDPLALSAGGAVYVLDTSAAPAAALAALPRIGADFLSRPRDTPLDAFRAFVDELVHGGAARRAGEHRARAGRAVALLETHGYLRTAAAVRRWHDDPAPAAVLDLLLLASFAAAD